MKKSFFLAVAAVTALFSACSSDELASSANDSNVVNVSFSANFDQVMPTRSVSGDTDGTQATKLYVAVYNANNELIKAISNIGVTGSQPTVTVSGKQATVNFQLVKGQTYSFAFWAQNSSATALAFDAENKKVTINYDKANDETLDAFTAHVNDLTVTGAIQQSVTLKRPWAQVNFGATQADVKAAHLAGIDIKKTKVTVNNVFKTLNLLDGTVADPQTADFELALNAIPAGQNQIAVDIDGSNTQNYGKLTVNATDYAYMGLNYLLVGGENDTQSLIKADLSLYKDGDDTNPVNTLAFSNVPVQRNYRTNIVGNLLTSQVQFNITIDPNYDNESNNELLEDPVAINSAIQTVGATVNLSPVATPTINLSQVAEGVTINGNGAEITLDNKSITKDNITIENCNIANSSNTNNGSTISINTKNFTLKNCTFTGEYGGTRGDALTIYGGAEDGVVTIEGCKIKDGKTFKALHIFGKSKVVVKDCEINATYPFNCNGSNCDVEVVNSTLEGWTSYNCGDGHSVTFTNCKFGKSYSGYAYLRPYNNTMIENCEFISEFRVNPNTNAITVNVNNSTWTGGTAVDATLIDWDGSHADAVVNINGVAVDRN